MRMTGHVLREEDRSGAGAPHRHPLCGTFAELRNDPVALRELPDRRALAARDDEPVDVVELLWPTHVDPLRTHAAEGGEVLAEIALETEDADARRRRERARPARGTPRPSRRVRCPSGQRASGSP